MRINAFSDLCLRVVMLLAAPEYASPQVTSPQGSAVKGSALLTSQQIADSVGIPYNHVSKAVIRLRELGLVDVTRGRGGGAVISSRGRSATVGWLLRRLDVRPDVADCHTASGDCPLSDGCGLRGALARAREAFYAELDDVVIASLAENRQSGRVFVALDTVFRS
ncbi:Rrf2 family transcriptional regulator [Paenarthrobacter sp. PH39-S1]|uniref:RrF2 family transcriptional regulator n=1 Tax=Paenarthrobacter sp. PH39-S1 TaxID=3046204 RepID=UPI0024BBE0CB|nr:Rrf2 family transcriptional regulator [Paenarthrobacter sp. PH39-S1]MDJ0354802.1 Rrf2 family transcriptional regulator [Paenarthrobacter sp. PH39-S1]